jgi:hypothetical protein
MRKALLALLLSGSAFLAMTVGSSEVLAAGVSIPRGANGVSESAVVRVDYYGWRRHSRCCGPRYYRRRPAAYGYYAPPRAYYPPPRPAYYAPPVVYYPPPVVIYPPPVVYGGYSAGAAPYPYYGQARYYRDDDYGW